jgi:hypothetical protein
MKRCVELFATIYFRRIIIFYFRIGYLRKLRSPFRHRYIKQHVSPRTRHVRHVPVRRQRRNNRLGRLDLPQRYKCLPGLVQCTGYRRCGFGFSFRSDHGRLPLLLRLFTKPSVLPPVSHPVATHLFNDKLGTLRIYSPYLSARYQPEAFRNTPCCAICFASTACVNS